MHDSDVVAFEIRRPWPSRSTFGNARPGDPRWRWRLRHIHREDCAAQGCDPTRNPFPWWRPSSYGTHMTLAGRGFYWPGVITVWHREPGGADSREVCEDYRLDKRTGEYRYTKRWRWHVHHWRIQIGPLQELHRRIFGRCGWCGARSTKRRPVNVSHQWDAPRRRLFRIDRSLFHSDCSSVETAHRACSCDDAVPGRPGVPGESPFRCLMCGLHHNADRDPDRLAAIRLCKTIPRGEFHPATYRVATEAWARRRARRDAAKRAETG